jgi:hypothetical protein
LVLEYAYRALSSTNPPDFVWWFYASTRAGLAFKMGALYRELTGAETADMSSAERLRAWLEIYPGVGGIFIWLPSHDQRQRSFHTAFLHCCGPLGGPEPGSRWSARSEARTNDLEAGEDRPTLGRGGKPCPHLALPNHNQTVRPTRDQIASSLTPGRWIVVFDNAEGHQALRQLMPQAGSGQVLVTSRYQFWDDIEVLHLNEMSPGDAIALLERKSGLGDPAGAARHRHSSAAGSTSRHP